MIRFGTPAPAVRGALARRAEAPSDRVHGMGRVLPVVTARVAAGFVATVMSSSGCAQLAGIDNTNNAGLTDSVALTRMSVGTTVALAPLDLGGLQATYFVSSADAVTRVPAATGATAGTWAAHLPDPVPVEITLPDVSAPTPFLLAFPNKVLQVLYAVLEHPAPVPAPADAKISLTVPLDAPIGDGEAFEIFTVGSWTSRLIPSEELPMAADLQISTTYTFDTSRSLSGRSQLDQLTEQDAFLILRHTGTALTGLAEAPAFAQTGDDMVNAAAMTAVVRDQMVVAAVDPAALAMRYSAVKPAVTVGSLAMSWSLVAAPGYRIASNAGPVLEFGGLDMTDVGLSAMYGNPFASRGWNTILTLATQSSRVFTPAGTKTPVTLYAGMNQFLEPAAALELDLPAGLPKLISVDGVQLSADGQTIAQPSKFVEVTFTTDSPMATLYSVQVFDLVANAAQTALDSRVVYNAAATEPRFDIPPEVFVSGHTYTLRAFSTLGGFPQIAAGDFTMRELPLSQAFLDSAVFTVTP